MKVYLFYQSPKNIDDNNNNFKFYNTFIEPKKINYYINHKNEGFYDLITKEIEQLNPSIIKILINHLKKKNYDQKLNNIYIHMYLDMLIKYVNNNQILSLNLNNNYNLLQSKLLKYNAKQSLTDREKVNYQSLKILIIPIEKQLYLDIINKN